VIAQIAGISLISWQVSAQMKSGGDSRASQLKFAMQSRDGGGWLNDALAPPLLMVELPLQAGTDGCKWEQPD